MSQWVCLTCWQRQRESCRSAAFHRRRGQSRDRWYRAGKFFFRACSRQAQNAFGRQAGDSHDDKNHVFKTCGFNLRGTGDHAGKQWPQLPGQIKPTQIALHGFRLVIFRRPQGSVFRPEPGGHILGKEVLQLPPIALSRRPGNIACVGSGKVSPGNSLNHDPTIGVLTISICSLRSVGGPSRGR